MARALGDEGGAATDLIMLADVISRQGDYAGAQALFGEAIEVFERLGERWRAAFALDSQAQAAARAGDFESARALHQRALGISRALGDERGVARTLMHLGDAAALENDRPKSLSFYRECIQIRQAVHDLPGVATAIERLAWVMMDDAPQDAARLLGSAEALRDAIKTPLPAGAREEYERSMRALQGRLGQQGFEAARSSGRALSAEMALGAIFSDRAAETPVPT